MTRRAKKGDWYEVIRTDDFVRDLAKIAAKCLKRLHPDDWDAAKMHLQDATSLYSPFCADMIDEELKK